MGKRNLNILAALSALLVFGCVGIERPLPRPVPPESLSPVVFTSSVEGMTNFTVRTKALNKTDVEKNIVNQYLFIFGSDGNLMKVQSEFIDAGGSTQAFQGTGSGSFVIDRTQWTSAANSLGTTCNVYILANIPDEEISTMSFTTVDGQKSITEANFLNFAVRVDRGGVGIGSYGIPMFGKAAGVDLSNDGSSSKQYNIELKALVARVDFRIDFAPTDVNPIEPSFPSFELVKYKVKNIPKTVRINAPTGETPSVTRDSVLNLSAGAGSVIDGGSLSFSFYVGETLRDAGALPGDYSNGAGMTSTEYLKYKQKQKPRLAKSDTPYVVLEGIYTSTEGLPTPVVYTIYLGENNWNDFNVRRNFGYKNILTIKGLNEYNDGSGGIEVDHRVEVSIEKVFIQAERITLLDCHIESRPVDITMVSNEARVTVEILPQTPGGSDYPTWMALEKRSTDDGGSTYLLGGNGKRKYFTTTLVSGLNSASRTCTISNNSDSRVWFYFDQNNNVSTDGCRTATARLKFYTSAANLTAGVVDEQLDVIFKQEDQYPVTVNSQQYAIEYYEEYLYNFDPKDNYGDVTDGMSWGLDGVQLSDTDKAIPNMSAGFFGSSSVDVASVSGAFYDFDNRTTGQGAFVSHAYSGESFTTKLINKSGFSTPAENGIPRSAAEYCYSKNYRTSSGTVTDMQWFLPAVDEIEPILIAGWSKFSKEFQGNYYWSSQPSYWYLDYDIRKYNILNIQVDSKTGTMFKDDVDYARLTRISSTSPVTSEPSTKSSTEGNMTLHVRSTNISGTNVNIVSGYPTFSNSTSSRINSGAGKPNQRRTAVNRVRCVRKVS